ncbi:MAG: HAMP domain-containing sensor histidine kinase [Proteobacteria bacterium]|nr:HAMP domain-containing sensor histidine kinase [Pseudomonadota bacterium]
MLIGMGIIDGALGFGLLLYGHGLIGAVVTSLAVGYLLIFLPLSFTRFHFASRVILPYFSVALLFIAASYYGPALNIHFTIFIGAIYPFLVFQAKETKGILLTLPAPMVFFFITEFYGYNSLDLFFEGHFHIPQVGPGLSRVMLLTTYAIISTTMYLFVNQAAKFHDNLEIANENLNLLIRTISHDIKNPLMVSSWQASFLQKTIPDHHKRISAIQRANSQIDTIIQNINEMQKAKSGKFRLNCERFIAKDLMEESIFIIQARLDEKQIEIEKHCFDDTMIFGSKAILAHSIIANILSNAIKFSHIGSKIKFTITNENQQRTKIIIEDFGVGIPESILRIIFDSYKHTTRPGTTNERGSGFGLPIAKAYLEAMNGSISIQSQSVPKKDKPTGTLITIELPS